MDKEIEGMDVAVGSVVSEGERRSSTLSTARDDEAVAALAPGQRWSLSRKRDVVLRLLQGEPVESLSRRLGLPVYKLEEWRQRGLAGIDAGLRERDDDPNERALAEAHRRIGALSMENELLRARLEKPSPLARRRSR
jgi:transposase